MIFYTGGLIPLSKLYKTTFHLIQVALNPSLNSETCCCGLIVATADDDTEIFVLLHLHFPRGGGFVVVLHFLYKSEPLSHHQNAAIMGSVCHLLAGKGCENLQTHFPQFCGNHTDCRSHCLNSYDPAEHLHFVNPCKFQNIGQI